MYEIGKVRYVDFASLMHCWPDFGAMSAFPFQRSRNARSVLHLLRSENVKSFGCRPIDGLATRTWAVVRKSPGKEPAGGRAIVVQQALW